MTCTPSPRPPWSQWLMNLMLRDATAFMNQSPRAQILRVLRILESQFAPARHGGVDVFLLRPDLGREARAAELGIGVVVEVHGGVDQHAVPLAGAEQRRIAVALAGRGIEAGAERRWHDDDVVLAGVDAMRDCPIDRGAAAAADVVVDHGDVLV